MIEMTTLGSVLLGALLFDRALQTLAEFLNLRGVAQRVPEAFKHEVDDERWERAKEYLGVRTRLAWVRGAVDFAVLLAFWFAGGFGWLDGLVQGLGFSELPTGLLYLGALGFGSNLISLPFQWWNDFGVEARFGFHRQTPASWWADRAKGALVGVLVGGPLLAVLLWAFGALGDRAWLVAWAIVTIWTVLLQYLAPSFILPLFMKFSSLEDEELRVELDGLAGKTGFPLTEVSVVDASNRSSHANAFFTGFGKRKRIALFDTLLERHSHDEVTAILAHEIGHWSLG
ncbi:MAG: STE24 endopeptidase, partial [Planctomycetota bacterium]